MVNNNYTVCDKYYRYTYWHNDNDTQTNVNTFLTQP